MRGLDKYALFINKLKTSSVIKTSARLLPVLSSTGKILLLLGLVIACQSPQSDKDGRVPTGAVTVKKTGQGYQLLRNGQPFVIKGGGGYSRYERLKECGGNSIRVWDTHDAERILNKAQQLGLTVNLGLWVEREVDGFDYYDTEAIQAQVKELRKIVLKYRNHPALLMWGVGNEWNDAATNIKVWDAVNEIAKMIHELDPNHPTTTSIILSSARPVEIMMKRCPHIDILSLNTYGALPSLVDILAQSGWTKPYLISEFGGKGYWETSGTFWQAPIEQTSAEKIKFIRERYEKYVTPNSANCLGSYVFFWGYKQECTPTWFSFFDEEGNETPLVGMMQYLWTGKYPENQAPQVDRMVMDGKYGGIHLWTALDSTHTAQVTVSDPDGDSLTYKWEVLPESQDPVQGNAYPERELEPVWTLQNKTSATINFQPPSQPGPYRLYAYVYDKHRHVGTANIPFYVKEQDARKAEQ